MTKSEQTGPIKIGYLGPLTGEAASLGQPGLAGAEFAVKEINDAGGLLGKKVELVAEDDKCSSQGASAMQKLVEVDKVIAVTGPDCSASAGPALPIAQKAGTPVVIRWASAPPLTQTGNYIFRVYPSDAFQGKFAADYIYNKLGKKKVAVIYVKNDWGQGISQVFTKTFKELGGEVVFEEGVLQDSKDLRTQLSKVGATKVDMLYFPVYAANGVVGLKQIQDLGLKVTVMGGDIFDATEIFEAPGSEGAIYTVGLMNNSTEFQKKAEAATGKKADKISAPMAYDGVKIIAEAIKKAGNLDKVKIRDEIAKTSLVGQSSTKIEFDENRELKQYNFEVKVIKNKKGESLSQ